LKFEILFLYQLFIGRVKSQNTLWRRVDSKFYGPDVTFNQKNIYILSITYKLIVVQMKFY